MLSSVQFCRHFNFFDFVVAAASLYFKKANFRFPIARERGIEITLRRHDQCALLSTRFLEFSSRCSLTKAYTLILKRQEAFSRNGANSALFKFYRNAVNRKRKTCKAQYYKSRVQQMKGENPKAWWKEVGRLSGMQSRAGDLLSQVNVEGIEDLSMLELTNAINTAFLEPLEEYRLPCTPPRLPLEENSPEFLVVPEERVLKQLSRLNPAKACGPDEIPNWLLREYAEFLVLPPGS